MMLRVVFVARHGAVYAAAITLLTALAWWQGRAAVVFNFTLLRPQVRLPYSEICALIAAAIGALILRTRFWQWDRTAGPRATVIAGAAALLGCLGPLIVVAVSFLAIPSAYWASWRFANALLLGAVVFLLAPLISPSVSGALVVLAYFTHGIFVNIWADLSFIPLTSFPESPVDKPTAHWLAASGMTVVAVLVNARSRGLTAPAQRVFDRDE